MSDMNLVIRTTKERHWRQLQPRQLQRRLGIAVGCMLALACASTESLNAQVVQAASEIQNENFGISAQLVASDSGRLTSRRLLVQFPQKGEPSLSDAKIDSDQRDEEKLVSQATDDKKAGENPDQKAGEVKQEADRGITPVQALGLKLAVDRVNIATDKIGTGVLPDDTAASRAPPSMGLLDGQSRGIVAQQVNWRPANICHFPLYFEDAMLERHGHVRWGHAQPIVSGAKFLATLPLLPYLKTMHPPCELRYTLGHFRPGSCAPALKDHLPWDRRAATVEAVSLGAFFWAAPL